MKIVVARGSLADLPAARGLWAPEASFVEEDLDSEAQIAQATRDADGVIVALQRLSRTSIEAMGSSVKVIGRAGVGVDAIDLDAARERVIAVINQPSYATAEVATHAVAMMLAVHRRLKRADEVVRSGWGLAADVGHIRPLAEMRIGVIGIGKIGRATIDRLAPFGADIIAYDPHPLTVPPNVKVLDSLAELLKASDAITLHMPLLADTHHLIDADALALMQPHAIVVNVSRGGLVDEIALAAALQSGRLAGAALDVFEAEPLSTSSGLLAAPNLLLSPHLAWYSSASAQRLSDWTAGDVVKYLNGEDINGNIVNR